MRVIVVGAGIAGLGAAYRLREEGHEVVLLEKDAEPGGRCRSVQWHGLWAVTGAFAFLRSETNLVEQAQKLAGDAVVMAVPGNHVAALMPGLDSARRAFFEQIDYAGHHIVYYMLDRPKGELLDTYVLPAADGFRRTGNLRFTDLGNGKTFAHSQWKDWGCRQHAGAGTEELLAISWADVVDAVPALQGTRIIDSFISLQPHAICKRPKGHVTQLKRFRDLGPLPRVAFCGDYLSNSTVGQSHWTGLEAARERMAG